MTLETMTMTSRHWVSRQPVRGSGDPSEGGRQLCQLQPVSPENSDDVK